MSTQVQFRRGTATEHTTFTGAVGEITVDTTDKRAVVHDGATAGGSPLAKESEIPTLSTLGLATSSIDNAVVRFDGTSGHTQNSGITISDSDVVSGAKVTATGTASSRSLETRFSETVNVKDFGALGDGSTNDASAILAAIAALPASGLYPGGTVFFPRGHYIINSTLTIPSYVTFAGVGKTTTRLNFSGQSSGNGIETANSTFFPCIRDMMITGAYTHNIYIHGASGAELENLYLTSARGGSGLYINGGSYMIGVRNVWASSNAEHGFRADGSSTSLAFRNCYANSNTSNGFSLTGCVYSALDACGADNQTSGYGYHIRNVGGVSFRGCGAESNGYGGWLLEASSAIASGAAVPDIHGVVLDSCFTLGNGSAAAYYSSFLEGSSSNSKVIQATINECYDFTSVNSISIIAGGSTRLIRNGGAFAGAINLSGAATVNDSSTVTPAADKVAYFTGAGTSSTADLTSTARSLLDDTSTSAMRTTLGLAIGTDVQAYDADLAALAANSTDGLWAHTGAGTGSARTLTAPAAGLTISNPAGIAGNPTFALANDLSAIEALSSTGIAARTGTDTWAQRTITAPASGISVSNGDGVSGNPTLALANDLSGVEGLATNGLAARTATDTWTTRTITGTANEITSTNGDGVSGNPTLSLPSTLTFTGKTVTGGTFASCVGSGTWTASGTWTIPAVTLGGAITYGGVTLSNAVTGTGSMVLSAGPSFTGNIAISGDTLNITSTTQYVPQIQIEAGYNGANAGYNVVKKYRSGGANNGACQTGDDLGIFLFQGKDQSGNYQNASYMSVGATAVGASAVTGQYAFYAGSNAGTNVLNLGSTVVAVPISTASTSSSTGALTVGGGAGIGGAGYFGGNIVSQVGTGLDLYIGAWAGDGRYNLITFNNTNVTTDLIGFFAAGSGASDNSLYANIPTGASYYWRVNNSQVANLSATALTAAAATAASSTSTGALISSGGLGVAGAGYFGGALNVTDSTAATSKTTGSAILSGGAGIAKSLWVGESIQTTAPVTKTADFTVAVTENYLICNKAGTITVTLPAASSFTGREIWVKTLQAQTVVSASSNVCPNTTGTAGTAILPATAGAWAMMVSDGTNWIRMASSTLA